MGQFGIGQAVTRLEDARLITGMGRYTDDIHLPNMAYSAFLRSPHAHARISNIDLATARSAPGVLAIYTAADVAANNVGLMPCKALLNQRDGSTMTATPHPVLADGVVRYVGDPVAFVVATSQAQAIDAAEMIEVEYEPLPAITDLAAAINGSTPHVWPDLDSNIAFDWDTGEAEAVDAALNKAVHVVELELVNNRVIANSLETRAAIGDAEQTSGKLTLYTGCQGVHSLRNIIANDILGIEPEQLRVVCPDVGGGFGMKIFIYPEQICVLLAAKLLGQPVKWAAGRSEGILSDVHGRDHITKCQLALDENHKFLALRAEVHANLGAYLSQFGPFIPTGAGATMYNGVYAFEAVHFHSRGVYTHTTPVDAYRGAGRPEATYVVERLVDLAAQRLGVAPEELRRKNFIQPEQMPFTTALGATYDSGEFAAVMDTALDMAEWSGLNERKRVAAQHGKLRGGGICYYVEQCGGGKGTEWADLAIQPDGRITLKIGTQTNGQGHATAYAQLLADQLDIDPARVELIQGDTEEIAQGGGTGGSRSLPTGGPSVMAAGDDLVAKAKEKAAELLEVAGQDLAFEQGRFTVKGTDKSIGLIELAARLDVALTGDAAWSGQGFTFPNGCHIAEVEIDADTGQVDVVSYEVCDDFGTLVNPMLVTGQVHGGVVQGLGQALMEEAVYDPDSGQLLSGSFMDYAMPRADNVAPIDIRFREVPCKTNPLGVKGCGEAGAIASPAAIVNAIVDALKSYGIEHVDMPVTPMKLWQILQERSAPRAAE